MAFLKRKTMDEQQPIKELTLPAGHLEARLIGAKETYMLAGRGTWKTSRGISLFCIDKIYEMPRSTGVLVGLSFEHLGDNTLPPLLQAWEEFGFSHGTHYVVGKKPPENWPKPHLGVINEKYDHVITWHNGTTIYLISLAKKASANGISAQWGVFDECKFMKWKELQDEIFPIFRANGKHFGHCGGYLSKFFATDKEGDPAQIQWLLDKREQMKPKKVQVVLSLAMELNELQKKCNAGGVRARQQMKPKMVQIQTTLAKLRSNMVHVVEIGGNDVVYAYGRPWLKDKQRNMGEREFNVAILNQDPTKPGDAFYPGYAEAMHTYSNSLDISPGVPLIIAADYQHSVAPITVAQLAKLPGHADVSLNYVDEVYTLANPVKPPAANGNGKRGGLTAAVQLFCDRYVKHIRKTVYYIFDQTAIGGRGEDDRHADKVINTLKKNRWTVIKVYTGQPPEHSIKYNDTDDYFKRVDVALPAISINRDRCPKLCKSITNAPVKIKNGKTAKDKSSETEITLDQSETTHFSDCFDMTNHAVLKLKRIKSITEARRAGIR